MNKLLNNNAKIPYKFNLYKIEELTYKSLQKIILMKSGNNDTKHVIRKRLKSYKIGNGKYCKGYFDVNMSFDIETTTINCDKPYATMYIWQCSINKNVIIGRHWEDFIYLLQMIKDILKPSKNQRLLCFIHNLNYELSFMRGWLDITDSFLKSQRQPLYVEHDNFIVFQDSYALTNQSLKKLAETYCNTQKCVGDLDYNIVRHYDSYIDSTELGYCCNDVLILDEYCDYYYKTYCENGFKPLTATGILNKEVQDGFNLTSDRYKRFIELSHPVDYDTYMWFMSCVYRGGYVHGNELYCEDIYDDSFNIFGADITSSYPTSMLYEKYGYRFRLTRITTLEEIEKYISNDYAVVFEATFYNIKRTTLHSIESCSKCIELINCGRDNGRVATADIMRVAITEQDYLSYIDFYTWERCEVHKVYTAQREYLPEYITRPLIKYYELKNKLKSEGNDDTIEYSLAKSKVNSFYGLTVKKLPTQRVVLNNEGWELIDSLNYEKQKQNGLLPYFGIYISAYSRRNLLKVVYQLETAGYPCLYMDTDSIKVMNYDEGAQRIFNDYNNEIKQKCANAKIRLGCTDLIDGLGEYDSEYGEGTKHGKVIKFKMLGAKRYMISTDKGYNNQTVAGLPKGIIFDTYGIDEAYEQFTDGMIVNGCKLTAVYVDEEINETITDYEGKTRTIHERSCVALVPTDFSLSIDSAWYIDIINMKLDEMYNYDRYVGRNKNND